MRTTFPVLSEPRWMPLLRGALIALALLGLGGCLSHPEPPASSPQNLTVGKVQGEIKVGMPASDVAMILGSPNIVTTDEKRREVWIYDKVSSESVSTSNSAYGTLLIVGAQTRQSQNSQTQRTLTVVIKYDEDKRVRDFSYNYSQF